MAHSYQQYVGDGIITNFSIPFPYLSQDHISVTVDGAPASFTFLNASTVQVSPAPANGLVVEVRRNSVITGSLVDFNDGSTLSELDLDTAALQALYLSQEAVDYAEALSARVDGLSLGGINPLASNIAFSPTGNISASNVQSALVELDNEKLPKTGGTLTGALTLSADPASALQAATKQYVDSVPLVFPGFIRPGFETLAPAGWVLMVGGTLGNATSGGTNRANDDTEDLFAYLWNNLSDSLAPVSGGRGANAAADFAANKTITVPDFRNRSLIGAGQSTVVETFSDTAVAIGTEIITVASNDRRWITGMPVLFNILSGSITATGISDGATLYVIRISSTEIKLATTLANAQNGTAINITAVGGGSSFRITHSFTNRTVGETGGEEAHAMSITELLAHNHTQGAAGSASKGSDGGANWNLTSTGTRGGNAAMNIMSPFYAVNWFIKL